MTGWIRFAGDRETLQIPWRERIENKSILLWEKIPNNSMRTEAHHCTINHLHIVELVIQRDFGIYGNLECIQKPLFLNMWHITRTHIIVKWYDSINLNEDKRYLNFMSYNKHHLYDTLIEFIEVDDLLNISYDQRLIWDDGERIKINKKIFSTLEWLKFYFKNRNKIQA